MINSGGFKKTKKMDYSKPEKCEFKKKR